MTHYTVHDPKTHMKIGEYKTQGTAFQAAYRLLPLSPGKLHKPSECTSHPPGQHVTVQEWDDRSEPLRQWKISGRAPARR